MDLDLDDLFNEADALASEETPLPPDLPLPSNYDVETPQKLMEIRDDGDNNTSTSTGTSLCSKGRGRGWYAKGPIEAGTVLLVEKPMAMIMRWEEDEAEDGDADDGEMSVDGADDNNYNYDDDNSDDSVPTGGSVGTALLTMRLAEAIQLDPKLWTEGISQLYPQDEESARQLPPWSCCDARVGMEMERCLNSLSEVPEFSSTSDSKGMSMAEEIRLRLPLIVRYNSLSVETGGELFIHPGPVGHASLSGTALFMIASFFNHSSRPNVSRWAVGDVTFFVANRRVEAGTELCISYVEHEILCEDSKRRTAALAMDFVDTTGEVGCDNNENDGQQKMDDNDDNDEEETPCMPVVDAEVQQELMDMPPNERLEAIDELLAQAEGKRAPEDHTEDDGGEHDEDEDEEGAPWFQCDAHQLRILQALTLDGMGQHVDALPIWESLWNLSIRISLHWTRMEWLYVYKLRFVLGPWVR